MRKGTITRAGLQWELRSFTLVGTPFTASFTSREKALEFAEMSNILVAVE